MSTRRSFGSKIAGALARAGSAVGRAVTSAAARRVVGAVGRGALKLANSELGQRAISGVVEGAVNAAVTGDALGDCMQRAVILNLAGVHAPVPDPLNATEGENVKAIKELRDHVRKDDAAIQRITTMEGWNNNALKNLRETVKKVENAEAHTQCEIELVENVSKTMADLAEHEEKGVRKLVHALSLEDRFRTDSEKQMIAAIRSNADSMSHALETERQALIEEAVEQTIDIGGEIAEHAAASVPLVGEGIAAGMATARGAMQVYKLGKTIASLSGLHTDHMMLPAITPESLGVMLQSNDATSDAALLTMAQSRLEHVEEVAREARHINTRVVAELKAEKTAQMAHNTEYKRGMRQRLETRVAKKNTPQIHVYTSAYDSDYVLIFHVVGPYHAGAAFLLCVDLATDYVHFEEVSGQRHRYGVPDELIVRDAWHVMRDFLFAAATHQGATKMHELRMRRSGHEKPIYIQSVPYEVAYAHMLRNAHRIARDPTLQMALLKGPLATQRKSLLGALQYDVAVLPAYPAAATPAPPYAIVRR
uniref:Outer capsid protein VP5 n=1 Tax=Bukakata virus TaxID=2547355 RepID=A0A482A546_9REOV|nr:VP5 [Bukakata virus]